VDELWGEDVRLAPETYRLYQEIGRTRDRVIRELLHWRDERADLQRMQDIARQAVRDRLHLQEQREEAVLQGLRRSERGRIPQKRNRELSLVD
jgi:predicted transcriptional regulator